MESRSEHFTLNDEKFTLQCPIKSDAVIKEQWNRHERDDRYFPYWLDAWNAAFGLYLFFKRNEIALHNSLEIGCGGGMLAQMLQSNGGDIIHSDLMPEAVAFCKKVVDAPAAVREFVSFDIGTSCFDSQFDLIFASDILYEEYLAEAVIKFVNLHLTESGSLYLADPARFGKKSVVDRFYKEKNLIVSSITETFTLNGTSCSIEIHTIQKVNRV
ncbi:MAG: class I SAM-dependent methyltransferase [Fibrobacterales bacterium]